MKPIFIIMALLMLTGCTHMLVQQQVDGKPLKALVYMNSRGPEADLCLHEANRPTFVCLPLKLGMERFDALGAQEQSRPAHY